MSKKYKVTKLSACMKGFNVGDIVTVSNFTSPGIYSHRIEKYGDLAGEYYKNVGYCDLDHLEPIKEELDQDAVSVKVNGTLFFI